MDLISVFDPHGSAEANTLAHKLGLNLNAPSRLYLSVDGIGLGIGFSDEDPKRPYRVDFSSPEWKHRRGQGVHGNSFLFRALGGRSVKRALDGTAGFGQDAMWMALSGLEVTAVERSPIVYELLRDGLMRAGDPQIHLVNSELSQIEDKEFDVVYLDPMFDKPKKSAKSPRPMQLLQALLPEQGDVEADIVFARKNFRRVVVKMPLKAEAFSKPSVQFRGQSIRYDVFVQ